MRIKEIKIMKKIVFFILFLSLIRIVFAGYISPECYNMVWGYVLNKEGKPVSGIKVRLVQSKTSAVVETCTDEYGLYSFNFFKNSSGYAKISINDVTTVYMEKWKAVRQDFKEIKKGFYSPNRTGYASKIVYITNIDNKYHKYICQYLSSGSKAVPLEYILTKDYKPCDVCKP
ncbi:MAG: hypothetical protein ABRQ38_18065 [Candidatus Eremiobacterota bacterium]